MNFLKRLFNPRPRQDNRFFTVYAISHRCKEPLTGQVDMLNELSTDEESDAAFFTRKVLHTSGEDRCFASVEVMLWFDRNKNLLRSDVAGGRWLDAQEYAAALDLYLHPPEDQENGEEPPNPSQEEVEGTSHK